MQNIFFYPTVSDLLLQRSESFVDYRFTFEKGEREIEIPFRKNKSTIVLDEETAWTKEEYDLEITASVSIKNIKELFGRKGVAPSDSTIRVALEWYSQKSKIRRVVLGKQISNDLDEYKESLISIVPARSIEADIQVRVILFLSKSSKSLSVQEQHLNNDEGAIIGTLDDSELYLAGYGSLFPIYKKPLSSNLLWTIEIENVDDVDVNRLSDSVKLIINTSHKDYKMLDPNSKEYCERLIYEIVESSLLIFFTKLKEDENFPKESESILTSSGSISEWISYCRDRLGFNFSNIEETRKSISSFFERG